LGKAIATPTAIPITFLSSLVPRFYLGMPNSRLCLVEGHEGNTKIVLLGITFSFA
jgi:hypothetical protein